MRKKFSNNLVDRIENPRLFEFLITNEENYDFIKIKNKRNSILIPKNKLERIWLDFISESEAFDKDFGTYKIELNNKSTYVFFSGMLSGQRALDLDTFKRLEWHLKTVRKEINTNSNTQKQTPSP